MLKMLKITTTHKRNNIPLHSVLHIETISIYTVVSGNPCLIIHCYWDVQIPNPKVDIFGTFSKIEPKIRKISKFQNNTKSALIDEIHQNLSQMKGPCPYFDEKF